MTTSITPSLLPSRALLWTFRILCSIALAISVYLAWTALNATEVYGCGGGELFDCSHVLNSRFAKIFGMPVSVPAVGMYASLLAVLAFFRPGAPESLLKFGWGLLTIGALSAGLAGIWFTSVQVFELEHLCQYCLGAHACGLTLAGLVIWQRPLGWMRLSQFAGASVAGIAVLIAGQLTAEPPQTFMVERYDDEEAFAKADPQLTSFEAPGATEEFGAPMEFDAPVEFAPPGMNDADLFAPPVTESAVADNLFAPPAEAVTVPAETAEQKSTDADAEADVTSTISDDASDITTSLAAPPTASVPVVIDSQEDTSKITPAGAVYLFFSAGTGNSIVSRMLLALPGSDDTATSQTAATQAADVEKTEDVASTDTEESQTAAKPVVAAPVVKERLVTVAGSRFSLNTRHWPLLGSPDAKYVFVEMFDYTCPHCRHTHHAIEGAFKRLGDKLAIIALPVPLERSCNPAAKGNGHAGACDQAKLAVAVWRCDRAKFRTFHHWMFEAQRSTSQARTKAEQLVGKDKLTAELALGHASSYIGKHVELYKRVGSGAVPKLMFPKSTLTGSVGSAQTLVTTIERELAAK